MAGKLTCMREGCNGPRQVALLIEWESMKRGASPMRAYTGLEVCRPCAWKIKHPTEVLKKEYLEQMRQSIVNAKIGEPQPLPSVRYCAVTHPEYLRYRRLRGMH